MLRRVLKPCSGSGRELWLVLPAVGLILEVTAKSKVSVLPGQDDHQRNVLGLCTCNTESLSLRLPTKTFTPSPLLQAHWHQSFLSNILNPVTWESDHLFHSILSLEILTNKEPYIAAICRLRGWVSTNFTTSAKWPWASHFQVSNASVKWELGAPFSLHLTAFEHCARILKTVKEDHYLSYWFWDVHMTGNIVPFLRGGNWGWERWRDLAPQQVSC